MWNSELGQGYRWGALDLPRPYNSTSIYTPEISLDAPQWVTILSLVAAGMGVSLARRFCGG